MSRIVLVQKKIQGWWEDQATNTNDVKEYLEKLIDLKQTGTYRIVFDDGQIRTYRLSTVEHIRIENMSDEPIQTPGEVSDAEDHA